jgi:hypothetical protein
MSADDVQWELHPELYCLDGIERLFGSDAGVSVDRRDHSTGTSTRMEMGLGDFVSKIHNESEDSCHVSYYAKDLHLKQMCREKVCKMPSLFEDDWLDAYFYKCRGGSDDYTFLYIGGPHTWTGLHFDVLCTYRYCT